MQKMARVDQLPLLCFLLLRRRRRRNRAGNRKIWSKNWIQKRQGCGVYANLLCELNGEDPEAFRQFHRLDPESFKKILNMVLPVIRKRETVMRATISPGERLAITLRFLATGKCIIGVHCTYFIEHWYGCLYRALPAVQL